MLTDAEFRACGAARFGRVSTRDIVFSEEVRQLCAQNVCRSYGTTWACPPGVGEVAACREKCLSFENGIAFSAFYPLEDSFDFEGMQAGHAEFRQVARRVLDLARQTNRPFLLLGNEGCGRCARCTYPEAPCRFPEELIPSVESYGIFVNELAASAGIPYSSGPNTVTYFGLLLY